MQGGSGGSLPYEQYLEVSTAAPLPLRRQGGGEQEAAQEQYLRVGGVWECVFYQPIDDWRRGSRVAGTG
jgi:hypothetical protein